MFSDTLPGERLLFAAAALPLLLTGGAVRLHARRAVVRPQQLRPSACLFVDDGAAGLRRAAFEVLKAAPDGAKILPMDACLPSSPRPAPVTAAVEATDGHGVGE